MFRFSEIQQFPDLLESFAGNFCTICLRFEMFGWMENALYPSSSHDLTDYFIQTTQSEQFNLEIKTK